MWSFDASYKFVLIDTENGSGFLEQHKLDFLGYASNAKKMNS